jgi:predicted RNA binding protein YcfA (HicA-like mRNA interferase family)
MSPKLKNVTVREFIRALEKDGFEFKRQRGSHKVYFHPERNRQVLIAYHHSSETILSGMLHDLIDDAGWTEDDLIRLKLMRKG